METWYPTRFEPNVERAYALQLLQRSILLGRLAPAIGIVAFVGYAFWDLMLDPDALSKTGPFRAAAILHLATGIGASFLPIIRTSPRLWTFIMMYSYLGVAILFPLILAQLPGGFVAGVGGLLTGMIFIPAMTNGVRQAAILLGSYLLAALLTMALAGATSFEVVNAMAWAGGGMGSALGFAYLLDVINRRAYHLERLFEEEKRRSEALLLNILPADIAARLKAQEEPLADSHDSVSVLFADLAGFSNFSQRMSANELVTLLNDLFSRFDTLAAEHGAEKIKTIGDAYMVATGLQGSMADHAEKIADLALGMQKAFGEFCRDNNVDLKMRIGVHSGAVIAGVIGKQKFSYDLWGNTVNLASRMESEGVPNRIQMSAETWQLLSDRYQSTPRGEIEIKGHMPRATYLLDGRR